MATASGQPEIGLWIFMFAAGLIVSIIAGLSTRSTISRLLLVASAAVCLIALVVAVSLLASHA